MNDYEAFNKFPWGQVAYGFLVTNVRSRCGQTTRERTKKEKNKAEKKALVTHLDLYGFAYALQFWAYKVMPFIAKLCATWKTSSSIPRML